jgi:hypothetical protein
MSGSDSIPPDIQRFILTSIPSVSHLEALLLMRQEPGREWDAASMARSLYIGTKRAEDALSELMDAGMITRTGASFRYGPSTPELGALIDEVASVYPKHIIAVTNVIHSRIGKQARQFGDAFHWNKPKE